MRAEKVERSLHAAVARILDTECSLDSCLAFSALLQNSLSLARRITERLHCCLHDFKWDNLGFGVQGTLGTRCL